MSRPDPRRRRDLEATELRLLRQRTEAQRELDRLVERGGSAEALGELSRRQDEIAAELRRIRSELARHP